MVVRASSQKVDVLPSEHTKFGPAIGESLAMRTVFGMLERIAPTDATVLLEGETGTGKDVLARAIHLASPRAKEPFVVVDCGAVSYTLIESELFGHERGAFTGAVASRRGAFEIADGGTLFLDEVGELPIDVQPKLLRVLEIARVPARRRQQDAAHRRARHRRDQARSQARGRAREVPRRPLFPPGGGPDHGALAAHAPRGHPRASCTCFCSRARSNDPTLGPLSMADDAISALAAHDWPGNVRELRNVLERAIYLARAAGETRAQADHAPGRRLRASAATSQLPTGPQLPRHARRASNPTSSSAT